MNDELMPDFFPVPHDVKAGQDYKWCGCGESKTPPLCDRDDCHEKCVVYQAGLTETVYFCGCKQSKDPPLCDGSHAKVLLEYMKNRK